MTLGTVLADETPPVVTDARLSGPVRLVTGLADIASRADDGTGSGLSGVVRVAPAGAGDDVDWSSPGAPGPRHVLVRAPGPGAYVVTVGVSDAVGNWGRSAPVTVRFPTPAEAADAVVGPRPGVVAGAGASPGAGASWAVAQVRRFARGRGLRLTAVVRVGRTAAEWRRMLGGASAARYRGYSTLDGRILLGPGVTRALGDLAVLRSRAGRTAAGGPSRADVDELVRGLAVLLHESGLPGRGGVGAPGVRGRDALGGGVPAGAGVEGRRGRHVGPRPLGPAREGHGT